MTTPGTFVNGASTVVTASTNPFQTVQGGIHYLAAGSTYRNAGSTAIDSSLASELTKLTTYPPVTLTTAISTPATLSPQAQRDSDIPDLGYHYAPLDYIASNLAINSGVTLTLTNGVAMGFYGTLGLNISGSVVSQGLPNQMNCLTILSTVQEQLTGIISGTGSFTLFGTSPSVSLRFTDVSFLASATSGRILQPTFFNTTLTIRDSKLRGVYSYILSSSGSGTTSPVVVFRNSISERCYFDWEQGYYSSAPYYLYLTIQNTLFTRCTLNLARAISFYGNWTITDNLFDATSPNVSYFASYNPIDIVGYNAFINGSSNPFGGTGNITGLARDFVNGPLGEYYYPDSGTGLLTLRDADVTRSAFSVGLDAYTTSATPGSRENAGVLDIGFHYVGLQANGTPQDNDGDGTADYLDTNSSLPGMYFGPNITYAENAAAVVLASSGWINDPGVANLNGSKLTISLANPRSGEVLSLPTTGTVRTSGSSVLYSSTTIGTWSGGSAAPLVVTLNASATSAYATAVLKAVLYNSGLTCSTRNVTATYVNSLARSATATKTIAVTSTRSAVSLAFKNAADQTDWKHLSRVGAGVQLPFVVTLDPNTPAADLSFSAVSSNQQIVSDSHLHVNASGTDWVLQVDNAGNENGVATITVTASDCRSSSAKTVNVYVGAPLTMSDQSLEIKSTMPATTGPQLSPDAVAATWLSSLPYSASAPTRLVVKGDIPLAFALVFQGGTLSLNGTSIVRTATQVAVATSFQEPNQLNNQLRLDFTSVATPAEIQECARAIRVGYPDPVSTTLRTSVETRFSCDGADVGYLGRRPVNVLPANQRPTIAVAGPSGARVVTVNPNASVQLTATFTDSSAAEAPKTVYWQVFKGDVYEDANDPFDFHRYSYSASEAEKTDLRQLTKVNALTSNATFTLPLNGDAFEGAYCVYRIRATASDGTSAVADEIDVYVANSYSPEVVVRPIALPVQGQLVTVAADILGKYTSVSSTTWQAFLPDGTSTTLSTSAAWLPTASFTPTQLGRYRIRCTATINSKTSVDESVFYLCQNTQTEADVVFVIDTSGSTRFAAFPSRLNVLFEEQSAFRRALKSLTPSRHRVGVVSFSGRDSTETVASLGEPFESCERIVDGLQPGGGTDLAAGLEEAMRLFDSDPLKRGVERVIFILTDGYPDNLPAAKYQAALARAKGVRVLAVAVPSGSADALKSIVSRPQDAVQASFFKVGEVTQRMLASLCDDGNAAPSVSIQPIGEIWQGLPVTFHAATTDDGLPMDTMGNPVPLKIKWSTSAGASASVPAEPHSGDITMTFNSPGTYTVTAEASENVPGGYKDADTKTITVRPMTDVQPNEFLVRESVSFDLTIFKWLYLEPGLEWGYDKCSINHSTLNCGFKYIRPYSLRLAAGPIDRSVYRLSSGPPVAWIGEIPWNEFVSAVRLSKLQRLYKVPDVWPRKWFLEPDFSEKIRAFQNLPDQIGVWIPWPRPRWELGDLLPVIGLPSMWQMPANPNDGEPWWEGPFVRLDSWVEDDATVKLHYTVSRQVRVPFGAPWTVSAGSDIQVPNVNQGANIPATLKNIQNPAVSGYTVGWTVVETPTGAAINGGAIGANSQSVLNGCFYSSGAGTLNPVVSFTQSGRYRLRVTVSKSGYDSAEDEVQVMVGTTTADLTGPDLVSFNQRLDGSAIPVIDLLSPTTTPVRGTATFTVSATLGGVPQLPTVTSWDTTLTPTMAYDPNGQPTGKPTITANGATAQVVFPTPGLYEIRAQSNYGVVRKRISVNAAPAPNIVGPDGTLDLSVPPKGCVVVGSPESDDGLPACSDPTSPTDKTVSCLHYSWRASDPRIQISDRQSPSPRITLSPLSAGDVDPAMTLTVEVSDGQLTGRKTINVLRSLDDPYVPARHLTLPPGRDEMVIPVVSGLGTDQGQIIYVKVSTGFKGVVELMPGGKSLHYRKSFEPVCGASLEDRFGCMVSDASGIPHWEYFAVRLVQNLTPSDYDVVDVDCLTNRYRRGWPLLLTNVGANYRVAAGQVFDGVILNSVKVVRRGCALCGNLDVKYQLIGVQNIGTTTQAQNCVAINFGQGDLGGADVAFSLTAQQTGTTELQALLQTDDNVVVSWPMTVTVNPGSSGIACSMAGNPVNTEVRLGDIIQLDPQVVLGTNTVLWTMPTGGSIVLLDAANLINPRIAFAKTGIFTVDLSINNGACHQSYSFTVMEPADPPLYAGKSYELDLNSNAGYPVQGNYCIKTLSPAGSTVRTLPDGVTGVSGCSGGRSVTLSGSEPLVLLPEQPGVYVISITDPNSNTIIKSIRVAPTSEAPPDPNAPVLTVDALVSTLPDNTQRRIGLSLSQDQPTIAHDAGPFKLTGSVSVATGKYYEVRLERIGSGAGFFLPFTGAGVPTAQQARRPVGDAYDLGTRRYLFADFNFRDIPNGDYKLSVVLFNTGTLTDNNYVALEERYISLQVPRHSGHLEFSRTDAVIGSGDSAIKIERTYNSDDALGSENQSLNRTRLGPGWRGASPIVSLQLLERRKSDTITSANIRDPKSSRDIIVVPGGSAEGIRYGFSGYIESPYWASDEGLGIVEPLPGEAFRTTNPNDDFDPWDYFKTDGTPGAMGRYSFIITVGDSKSQDEFDFSGFQWVAPGGARYVFTRGASVPRDWIPTAGMRNYDTLTYPQPPSLAEIDLTDGTVIIPKEVTVGAQSATDLEVYPGGTGIGMSRRVRLLYSNVTVNGATAKQLQQVQDATVTASPVTLVSYTYYSNGTLQKVVRRTVVQNDSGATPYSVDQAETYSYEVTRPQLLTSIANEAGQIVLSASYDAAGQMKLMTDVEGVAQSVREIAPGGGDGMPPGSSGEIDHTFTLIGNLTPAEYRASSGYSTDASTIYNWITTGTGNRHYLKISNSDPNSAGMARTVVITVPAFSVGGANGLTQVDVPAMGKVINRSYDDTLPTGATSIPTGRRLLSEMVRYNDSADHGKFTYYEYGNSDLPIVVRNPSRGGTTHTIYDEAGKIVSRGPGEPNENALDETTIYDDATGRVSSTTDARGLTLTYSYDQATGRLDTVAESWKDATGGTVTGTTTKSIYAASNDTVSGRWKTGDLIRTVVSGKRSDGSSGVLSRTDFEYDSLGRNVVERRFRAIYAATDFATATGSLTVAVPFNLTGDITDTTRVKASVTKQVYDEAGRVLETQVYEEDAGGTRISPDPIRKTRSVYDALGRLESIFDEYGNKTRYYYDKAGNRVQTMLPGGAVLRTLYDINRRPIISQREYLPFAGNDLESSDSAATRTVYDGFGRVFYTELLPKVTLSIVTDAALTVPTVVNGTTTGTASLFTYSVQLVSASSGVARSEQHYNASDEALERIEFLSASGQGGPVNLTKSTTGNVGDYPIFRQQEVGSASIAQAGSIPSVNGDLERQSYEEVDSTGRLVQSSVQVRTSAGASTFTDEPTTYEYRLPTNYAVDTPDVRQVVKYDAARVKPDGRLATTDEEKTSVGTSEFDAHGNITKVTDPSGSITEKSYDDSGRLTRVRQWISGVASDTLYRYDEAGNLVWRRDALNRVICNEYDYLGRRTKRTSPSVSNNTGVGTWAYDFVQSGAWVCRLDYTDLAGTTMRQEFDARGRLIKESPLLPAAGDTFYSFAYIRLAQLPTWIPGAVANQSAQLRTVTELLSDGVTPTRTNSIFYDGACRLRAKGTPEGTICYTYDAVTARLSGLKAYRAAYTVDTGGTETWGGNSTYGPAAGTLLPDVDVSYAWDYAGRLASVTDNKLTTADKTTTYVHEAGRLLGQRYPNGLTTVFKYDSLGDLSAIEFNRKDAAGFTLDDITAGATPYWSRTPKASLVYTRDFAGQRRRSLDLLPQANVADGTPLKRQFQHQYDSGHRLITEWVATDTTAGTAFTLGTDFNAAPSSANLATVAYAMNLVGNRGSRTKTVSGTDPLGAAIAVSVGTYAYDNQDRATTVGALAPTWDARDNTLNPGYGKTYGWDRRNRLVKVTAGTVTTLGYDAEGLRVSKQVGGGSVTNYLVDTFSPTGYPQVLVEYTGAGTGRQPQRTYTYGLDLISQRTISGGLVEFFSNDALGTTRFLTRFDPGVTSLDGQLGELTTQTFTYDAYGLLASGSATATAYLYTGEQWDNDVGAYYLRARWYLPEWGRFLSRDSFEGTPNDPLSLHKFIYCAADPVNRIDPSGNEYTISGQTGLMGNLGTVTRFTTSVLRTAYKAKTTLEFMQDMLELGNFLLSGEFTTLIRSKIQDSIDVTKAVNVDEAVESLLRHTDTLMIHSTTAWGPWMVANAKNVDRFVIYLPTAPGVPYFETKIPTPSRLKVDLALGFGSGNDERASRSKGGRLTGVGVGLKGDRQSKQVWRMDFHPAHDIRGTGDHAASSDILVGFVRPWDKD